MVGGCTSDNSLSFIYLYKLDEGQTKKLVFFTDKFNFHFSLLLLFGALNQNGLERFDVKIMVL